MLVDTVFVLCSCSLD